MGGSGQWTRYPAELPAGSLHEIPVNVRRTFARGSRDWSTIAAMTRARLNSPPLALLFAACCMQIPGPAIATDAAMISGNDDKGVTGANTTVVAKAYPDKPVRMIEPFGVGGGPDLQARALSPKLSELWGEPVTAEKH